MDHYQLVRPEHLNHHGSLFGGCLLGWIDEAAYLTANLEFPGHRFVTIALDGVEFRHPVANGEILRLEVERDRLGTTSLRYRVRVFGSRRPAAPVGPVFETGITLVNVDAGGRKSPLRAGDEDRGQGV